MGGRHVPVPAVREEVCVYLSRARTLVMAALSVVRFKHRHTAREWAWFWRLKAPLTPTDRWTRFNVIHRCCHKAWKALQGDQDNRVLYFQGWRRAIAACQTGPGEHPDCRSIATAGTRSPSLPSAAISSRQVRYAIVILFRRAG
jgi:hypothetical protein